MNIVLLLSLLVFSAYSGKNHLKNITPLRYLKDFSEAPKISPLYTKIVSSAPVARRSPRAHASLSAGPEFHCFKELMAYIDTHQDPVLQLTTQQTPLNRQSVMRHALKVLPIGSHFTRARVFKFSGITECVCQADALINVTSRDKYKRANHDRMKGGLAPLGPDLKPINLHHVAQTPGLLAEMTQTFHNQFYSHLHFKRNKFTLPLIYKEGKLQERPVDRKDFNQFKREYWKKRQEEWGKIKQQKFRQPKF